MKLSIASSDRDHAILVCDEDHNDIAEFFHNEHATVGQSYETALALARKLVEPSTGQQDEREVIARIIEPTAYHLRDELSKEESNGFPDRQGAELLAGRQVDIALTKADRVIALLSRSPASDDLHPVRSTLRKIESDLRSCATALGEGDDLGAVLTGYADAAKAVLARSPASGNGAGMREAVEPSTFTVEDAWRELVEKDDRTSPEEYPDMALIASDELANFMRRYALHRSHAPAPDAPAGMREALDEIDKVAGVVEYVGFEICDKLANDIRAETAKIRAIPSSCAPPQTDGTVCDALAHPEQKSAPASVGGLRDIGISEGVAALALEVHARRATPNVGPIGSDDDIRFLALSMAGEAGEAANVVKKAWRDGGPLNRAALAEEIAGTACYLISLAAVIDINLSAEMCEQMAQFELRYAALSEPTP